ncbi:YitT family protein [Sporolactobacillus sp. CPB3-1]|uniref:YitT family protein n=1 Tax=Sporolactobacillus mangiferae TaxID=2940498 RepID=A0ABT0MBN2_9BACL|nr:YitT family protein [Sporolactobacillus mangiferae]MCL1632272.1 YitT family protein [Sporolactobacillus mangiferae]
MHFFRKRDKHVVPERGTAAVVMDYLLVIIGSFIVGITFNTFMLPTHIASGGVAGISIVLHWNLGWEPSYVLWGFNIPIFVLGLFVLGRSFGYVDYAMKTLLGSVMLPLSVFLTSGIPAATDSPLLGALFGGVGTGIGLGIVFRGRGSTGGTALAGQIIQKFSGITLGFCVSILDGIIVLSSAFFMSLEAALYALISIYLTAKMIDVVQLGFNTEKMALIVSDQEDELRQAILQEIDRGVTRIVSQGGYTGDDRPMLMTVVSQSELTHLKQLVKSIDADSFFIITNATEVFGKGFYQRS